MHEPTYGVFCLWPAAYGLPYHAGAAKCMLCMVIAYATWSPMHTYGLQWLTCGLLCLPGLLGLPMVSYAYQCGLLCLPSLLGLPMVS